MSRDTSSGATVPSATCSDASEGEAAGSVWTRLDTRSRCEAAVHAAVGIFPLALGLGAAILSYGRLGPSRDGFACATFLAGVLLIYVVKRTADQIPTEREFFVKALFCALLAMSLRSLVQTFLNVEPMSDFLRVHTNASAFMRGEHDNLYAARYPYWGFFAVVLSWVYRVFGKGRLVWESLNLVCAGVATLALCYAGRRLTRRPVVGLAAGLIFAFWPMSVAYASLLTPEHPFIMLLPCALLTFSQTLESRAPGPKLSWMAATGCLVGLMECFKPVAIALLLAFLFALLFHRDHGELPSWLTRPRLLARFVASPRRRFLVWTGALVLVLGGTFEATKEAGYLAVEQYAGYPINRYGLGETLRVGLDPTARGRYGGAVHRRVEQVEEQHGADFEGTNRVFMAETRELVQKNWHRMPEVLRFKFDYMWSSEEQALAWCLKYPRDNGRTPYATAPLRRFALPWCDAYWILVLVLACAGAVLCVLRRPGPAMLSVGVFVAGVASVLLFTEVQQRYRSVLAPALALLAACGALGLASCLSWSREGLARALVRLRSSRERGMLR